MTHVTTYPGENTPAIGQHKGKIYLKKEDMQRDTTHGNVGLKPQHTTPSYRLACICSKE